MSVDLGDRLFSVGVNEYYLGDFTGGIRFTLPTSDSLSLQLYGTNESDTIRINRKILLAEGENYSYRLAEVNQSVFRIRYSGSEPNMQAQKIPLTQDSTWNWPQKNPVTIALVFGPTSDELKDLESELIELEPIIDTITATTTDTSETSIQEETAKPEITQICEYPTEFERLRNSRELAVREKLSEEDMRAIMKCLQFDNSRLLLINDVASFYRTNPWFTELGDVFEFDLSRKQYLEMVK